MDFGKDGGKNGRYEFIISEGKDTLTLIREGAPPRVFIKTGGVTVPEPWEIGSLVLGDSALWSGGDNGIKFMSNNRVVSVSFSRYENNTENGGSNIGIWTALDENPYTADSGKISITVGSSTQSGSYVFSNEGELLILTLNGVKTVYNISRPAVIETPPDSGSLVLPIGKAWVYSTNNGKKKGYLFVGGGIFDIDSGIADRGWRANREGSYLVMEQGGGFWMSWNDDGSSKYVEFAFSGKTMELTIDDETRTYTVASGVNIPTGPPAGGDIALPKGQAWTYTIDGKKRREGYIFLADKRVFQIDSGNSLEELWRITREGSYYTSATNNTVNITWKDAAARTGTAPYSYSVSGDVLILAGMEYTKTSGVDIDDIKDVKNNLAFPTDEIIQGWTRLSEYGDGTKEGYIFLTDGRAFSIDSIGEDGWRLSSSVAMKYETTGSFVAITRNVYMNVWITEYYSYTIANGYTLTMTSSSSGNERVYTITSGIDVAIPPPSSSKSRAGTGVLKAFAKK